MIISHNISALATNNALSKANAKTDKASRRLSTGLKINSAADDAAGLAISNKMKAQIRGLEMANRNCNDAISLVQTTEGGLAEVENMLQRMRELAVQSANDALTDNDREKIQTEVDELVDEITKTSDKIQFNNKTLFNDEAIAENPFVFQVGANQGLTLELQMERIDAETLNIQQFTDSKMFSERESSGDAISICDEAIETISKFRAKLGAFQNRLDYTSAALETSNENSQTSLSRIQDSDMAEEMTTYTTNNVIVQAGISVLSQANQRPNQILSLLQ